MRTFFHEKRLKVRDFEGEVNREMQERGEREREKCGDWAS
jgi:hypothetical protein